MLSQTILGEGLYLYLSVTAIVVSTALVREEGKTQHPVYYISRALRGVEPRYPPMELLAFALVVATHQLRPYFQVHPIKVLTEAQLKKILQRPDMSRLLVNWSIKLSEFDIDYVLWMTIKGQALANFISEMMRPCEGLGPRAAHGTSMSMGCLARRVEVWECI